jgi:hypothetical protein
MAACGRLGPNGEPVAWPFELCCNSSWYPLGLVSEGLALHLEGLDCGGDNSRSCCSASATGQAIVATGTLEWVANRGTPSWTLLDPQLCALP